MPTPLNLKIRVIASMTGHLFKEIYQLLTGKRKWSKRTAVNECLIKPEWSPPCTQPVNPGPPINHAPGPLSS